MSSTSCERCEQRGGPFCVKCGENVVEKEMGVRQSFIICRNCGHRNWADANFCGACGTEIGLKSRRSYHDGPGRASEESERGSTENIKTSSE